MKFYINYIIDALFDDAFDTPRTIITGFIAGILGFACTPVLGIVLKLFVTAVSGVVGGIASMYGKEVYLQIKKKITDEKTD
jgi:phage shock protein PspC (stress-responsive transcriptional regulator)